MKKWISAIMVMCVLVSCNSGKKEEKLADKDSISVEELMKDPKNYFRDCRALFARATALDSTLYTQTDINKKTALEAITAFTNYAYYCNNDTLSPVFLIKTAQIATSLNNVTQARMTLEKCIEDYDKFEGIPTAIFLLAQLYDEKEYLNNEAEARRLYEQLIKDYPNSPEAESARGAVKYLGMTDKQIIQQLKKEQSKTPKVSIQ